MMSETKLDNLEENILNKKSQYTNIAGILLILAGIIAVISWIPYITGDQLLYQAF